jgi:dipeptidase D
MVGARGLKHDFLKSSYLVNLDSEEDWKITVGCAGGFNVDHTLELEVEDSIDVIKNSCAIHLSLSECQSGHSGCEIHIGRANPISCIGRILRRVETELAEVCCSDTAQPGGAEPSTEGRGKVRLAMVTGGAKRNVIPADASAVMVVDKVFGDKVMDMALDEFNKIMQEYELLEPTMKFEAIEVSAPQDPSTLLTPACSHKLISLILTAPHGVLRMSPVTPDIVETSINFYSIRIHAPSSPTSSASTPSSSSSTAAGGSTSHTNPVAVMGFFARSLCNSQLAYLQSTLEARCGLMGLTTTPPLNFYYGWAPDVTSDLFHATRQAFVEVQGKEPVVSSIHAGLECGIIMGVFPNLKSISIGPHITSPHTINESLHLTSVKPFYETTRRLLVNLAK